MNGTFTPPETEIKKFQESPYHFAISLMRTDENRLHTGILYKDSKGTVRILHFAFHHLIKDELYDNAIAQKNESRFFFWVCIKLTQPPRVKSIMYHLERIATRKAKVAYAFNYKGGSFNAKGFYQPKTEDELGLTCSTFVLAAFKEASVTFLKFNEWLEVTRSDDEIFKAEIVQYMRQRNAEFLQLGRGNAIDPAHIEMLANSPCKRIRPEEVVASAYFPIAKLPVGFKSVETLGEKLNQHVPKRIPILKV